MIRRLGREFLEDLAWSTVQACEAAVEALPGERSARLVREYGDGYAVEEGTGCWRFYLPSQPRDRRGRWTKQSWSGGGAEASPADASAGRGKPPRSGQTTATPVKLDPAEYDLRPEAVGKARTLGEAEAWARKHLPGLASVDFSHVDAEVANSVNRVVYRIAAQFGVSVKEIRHFTPQELQAFHATPRSYPIMAVRGETLMLHPDHLRGPAKERLKRALRNQPHKSEASKSLDGVVAHEMGHRLQASGHRPPSGPLPMGRLQLEWRLEAAVNALRSEPGAADRIRRELGRYAWKGNPHQPTRVWAETWSEGFSAWWTDRRSLSPRTRRFVEEQLTFMYPEVKL